MPKPKLVDAVEVTVHPTVAGPTGTGTRRRAGHTFSVHPVHFPMEEVPKEVKDDSLLRRRKVKVEERHLVAATEPESDEPTTSQPEPDQSDESPLDQLTAIDGIGPATAEKLLAHGLQKEKLASATEDQLRAAGLQDAQVTAVLTFQEQLKAERIQ